MTVTSHNDRERVEDEAASWLVFLSEDPNDVALRARFETWRTAHPLHAEIWARTARAYDAIGRTPPQYREDWRARAPPSTSTSFFGLAVRAKSAGFASPKRIAGMAATAAIAACLAMTAAPSIVLRLEADRVTGTGELQSAALPDGSSVQLAPQSAIRIEFAGGARRVRLLKGAAFFQVVHDQAHPFRVAAGDALVTDLGTAFEVRREGEGARVAVVRGHVQVDGPAGAPPLSAQLFPGDWSLIAADSAANRGAEPTGEIAAWREGELVVRGRPISEVVEALRPYYAGLIVVRDDALAQRRVSGLYALRDPVTTLRDLAASHGATVRQISPWLLVVTAG